MAKQGQSDTLFAAGDPIQPLPFDFFIHASEQNVQTQDGVPAVLPTITFNFALIAGIVGASAQDAPGYC